MKKHLKYLALCLVLIIFMPLSAPEKVYSAELSVAEGKAMIQDGNYLYYKKGTLEHSRDTKNVSLVKRKSGTKKEQKLADADYKPIYLRGTYIYFTKKDGLYRVRTDGKKQSRLFKGDARIIGFNDSYLYFNSITLENNEQYINTIYKIGVNGTGLKELLSENTDSANVYFPIYAVIAFDKLFAITSNNNYYSDIKEPNSLYYIDLNTNEKKVLLSDTRVNRLFTNGSAVFYKQTTEETKDKDGQIMDNQAIYSLDENDVSTPLIQVSAVKDVNITKWIDIEAVYNDALYYNDYYNFRDVHTSDTKYTDESYLYRLSLTDKKETLVLDINKIDYIKSAGDIEICAVNDSWIVAKLRSENWDQTPYKFYYFRTDGSGLTQMELDLAREYADLVGGYIYYPGSQGPRMNIDWEQKYTYQNLKLPSK